ncbi:hypothetical protein B0O41_2553 [Propionibacteriaceae bacterium ES.041]|uniref:phosphoribosyl-ATP pyrophosphohydrolase n=1 Tax=Enemella evansiae TaxID=2016499 RepID=UPI000C0167F5|nr:phosphoribosyl-ATP pyrophosphohydrolase [Enemella evansiae]PFG67732.1 hypothetical protein B0O41_2553 [Propionibacteriaceae bacterium ES.041]
MEMSEWTDRLELISDGYAEVYGIDRSPEWMLLKLTEELGELSQAWLVASGQGRDRNQSPEQARDTLAAECADVVAMALLTARRMGVDIEASMTEKWLVWEDYHRRRRDEGDAAVPPIALDNNAFGTA